MENAVRTCPRKEGVNHTNFTVRVRLAETDRFVVVLLEDLFDEFPTDLVLLETWPAQQNESK